MNSIPWPRCPGPCSSAPPINPLNRREFLKRTGNGFGLLGLPSLLERGGRAGRRRAAGIRSLAAKAGHFPAKAKRCIFLFMTGGPSQMDMFDPKPLLNTARRPAAARRASARSTASSSRATRSASAAIASGASTAQSGIDMSDLVPAHAPPRRRHRADPLVRRRQRDPRAGDVPDEHGSRRDGLPQPGELGHVRPRDPRARTCRPTSS